MDDWQAILADHTDAVWRRAYRLLGNEADAADCFQDSFAAAVTLSRKEPVRNWRGLLLRLATCRALAMLRRRIRRHRDRTFGVDLSAVVGREAGPDRKAELAEFTERVREAMAQLPPGRRRCAACDTWTNSATARSPRS